MKTRFAIAAASAILVFGASACGGSKTCRPNTAFVTATLDSASAAATTLNVTLSVAGAAAQSTTVARTPGASSTIFEVTFAAAYPAGSAISVDVVALAGGAALGHGQLASKLSPGCSAFSLTVSAGGNEPDLRAVLDAGGDAAAVLDGTLVSTEDGALAGDASVPTDDANVPAGDASVPLDLIPPADLANDCVIDGTIYVSGTLNPGNACQICQPTVTSSAWTNDDGTSCSTGKVCNLGACVAGCAIVGTYYATSTSNPTNACQSCQPTINTTAWSGNGDGTSCGNGQVCANSACGTQCDIGGTIYATGALNPASSCQSCQPGTSTSAWSNVALGTSCASGEVCNAGTCAAGCFIGGVVYVASAKNPANACQTCQPATSTTAFTASVADGTACGTGEVCNGGSCIGGCYINGHVVTNGALDTGNCETCDSTKSTSAWTVLPTGTSCGTGEVCASGTNCEAGCFITGVVYASGASNTANSCQTCQPAKSTTAWSDLATGTSCGTGTICNASNVCAAGCYINSTVYTPGALNPSNSCQSCQPMNLTTQFTNVAPGTSCGAGKLCVNPINNIPPSMCSRGVFFASTGSPQTFTVPAGVTQVTIEALGGGGTSPFNYGGQGGFAAATIAVTPGENLGIYVGGAGSGITGGYNGGGSTVTSGFTDGGGGGGASDVRQGGSAFGNRIVVAGGGGGGGGNASFGGTGGGNNGGSGSLASGGTQTAGGTAGCNGPCGGATDGTTGTGGKGASTGAGGGGGYYGGGGANYGSGGAGSGFIASSATNVTLLNGIDWAGNQGQPGWIQLTY